MRTHGETGRKALYLGGSPKYQSIVGHAAGRRAARCSLSYGAMSGTPDLVWAQVWRAGDMVMWDNRCVMHRRDAFDLGAVRLMHRTAIEGERPV